MIIAATTSFALPSAVISNCNGVRRIRNGGEPGFIARDLVAHILHSVSFVLQAPFPISYEYIFPIFRGQVFVRRFGWVSVSTDDAERSGRRERLTDDVVESILLGPKHRTVAAICGQMIRYGSEAGEKGVVSSQRDDDQLEPEA